LRQFWARIGLNPPLSLAQSQNCMANSKLMKTQAALASSGGDTLVDFRVKRNSAASSRRRDQHDARLFKVG
jgi:hypothetical protein